MTPLERQQLIDALLDGAISEADFIRLEAELTIDPVARQEYYERVGLSLILENEAARLISTGEVASPAKANSGRPRASWRVAFLGMSAVAAALLLALLWRGMMGTPGDEPVEASGSQINASAEPKEEFASGFAVISGQADAVWEDGRARAVGSLVPPGEFHLRSGVVQLELFSGVVLVVEGQTQMTIHSPMEVAVVRGKVRARVPEPAQGFRVRTSTGQVVDLGTEFAVSAGDDETEVHVIDGQIDWHLPDRPARRLGAGEAIRRDKTGNENVFPSRADAFVGTEDLRSQLDLQQDHRLQQWTRRSEASRHDPRLVAYYQMSSKGLDDRLLSNLASGAGEKASSGAIVAGSPAADRWGRAGSAMNLSPAGSRIRVSVPGEHRSISLICWVRINSLDRWYNSLFLTDGHEQGEPHWQIMDDGRLFFSVKKRDVFDREKGEKDKHIYYSPVFWTSALSGQWLMLATVYDIDARRVTHYLNGEVLSEESIPEEYLVEIVRIGSASSGNGDQPKWDAPHFAVRNFNGNLDEFRLYSAALTGDEIRSLYTDGKP